MANPNNPTLDEQINNQLLDPQTYPRPVTSSIDTWDQNTQLDYPISNRGSRPGWNVPSIAVTNETVNTIQANQNTRIASPQIATPGRGAKNPFTVLQKFMTVPNMGQSIYTDSHVTISFSINVTTQPAPGIAIFAIFRDGHKISQEYHVTTSDPNIPQLGTGNFTDTSPGKLQNHAYDLRWRTNGSGRITAWWNDRTFTVSNQRAQ